MRVASYLMFTMDLDEARIIFSMIGREKECESERINPRSNLRFQAVELFTDSGEYRLLIAELVRRGVTYRERFSRKYSKAELDAAEYLRMRGGDYWGYPQPDDRHPGYRQLCYDPSSACPLCGNGARQSAPFMLKKTPPSRREWWMLNWEFEYLVSERVANLVVEQGLTGCEFWPLLHYRTQAEIPGWKQLVITHELPPMSCKTQIPLLKTNEELVEEFGEAARSPGLCACGKCGRNAPDVVYYDRSRVGDFEDFNKTAEWLGGGASTWQMMIISQSVRQFCSQNGLDPADLEPIEWA